MIRLALRLLGASSLPIAFLTVTGLAACGNSEDTEPAAAAHDASTTSATDATSTRPTSTPDAATSSDAGMNVTDAASSSGDAGDGAKPDGGAAVDSGADSGTGITVTGVNGTQTTFKAVDAVSGDTTDGDDSFFNGTSTSLFITSFTGACADLKAETQAASTADVFLQLAVDVQSGDDGFTGGPVTGPATFTVGDLPADGTNSAMGEIDGFTAMCGFTDDDLQTGTVVITARTAAGLEGTIDAMSEGGVHLTGHFSAATCSSVSNIPGDAIMCTQ